MSWAAMNYVFRLPKRSGVVGNLRFLLLCIARQIPKRQGCIETVETPLGLLARMTGLDRKTVCRLRDQLVERGEIEIGQPGRGRGRFQTYRMPKLAGPLFSIAEDLEKEGEMPPLRMVEKGGNVPPIRTQKGARRPVSVAASTSSSVRTKRSSTSAAAAAENETGAAAEVFDRALQFLDWWSATYPQYHHGAQATFDIEQVGPLVVELLTKPARTDARLRDMAVAMWTVTPDEDAWLPRATDRGLKLLKHAADRLDRIAAQRAAAPPSGAAVEDPLWTAVLERVEARVSRHVFHTWFRPLRLVAVRGDVLVVTSPDALAPEWITRHYAEPLRDALDAVRPGLHVEFPALSAEVSA